MLVRREGLTGSPACWTVGWPFQTCQKRHEDRFRVIQSLSLNLSLTVNLNLTLELHKDDGWDRGSWLNERLLKVVFRWTPPTHTHTPVC